MQNENDKSMFNNSQLYLLCKDIVFLFAFKHEEILFIILWHYDYGLHFSLNYLAYIFLFDERLLTLNFYFYFLQHTVLFFNRILCQKIVGYIRVAGPKMYIILQPRVETIGDGAKWYRWIGMILNV